MLQPWDRYAEVWRRIYQSIKYSAYPIKAYKPRQGHSITQRMSQCTSFSNRKLLFQCVNGGVRWGRGRYMKITCAGEVVTKWPGDESVMLPF